MFHPDFIFALLRQAKIINGKFYHFLANKIQYLPLYGSLFNLFSRTMDFHHVMIHKTSIQTIELEFDQELSLFYLRPSLKQILLVLIGLNFFIGFLYRGLLFKNFLKNGGLKTPINFLTCKFLVYHMLDSFVTYHCKYLVRRLKVKTVLKSEKSSLSN